MEVSFENVAESGCKAVVATLNSIELSLSRRVVVSELIGQGQERKVGRVRKEETAQGESRLAERA
jgi:hypothetical protein